MIFQWDPKKARRNLQKHGVTFEEAASVFRDRKAVSFLDTAHSEEEERQIVIGFSENDRAIFVCHCESADRIRIISARKATQKERLQYEEAYGSR